MTGEALRLSEPEDVYISAGEIGSTVSALGEQFSEKYSDTEELVAITVLLGAAMFACDLVRAIEHPDIVVDTVAVKSYAGTESSGQLTLLKSPDTQLKDKQVLVVEDILDSGRTLNGLVELLWRFEPASLEVVTLLEKPERRVSGTDISAPVTHGIRIADRFIVGYGLDYNEHFRHLPHISTCVQTEPGRWVPAVLLEPQPAET